MANLIDAQNQVNVQRETTTAVVDLKDSLGESFKEIFQLLVDNNTYTESEEQNSFDNNRLMEIIVDKTSYMVKKVDETADAMDSLVNSQKALVSKPDSIKTKTLNLLTNIGSNLKNYVKTSIKNKFDQSKFGKLVGFVKDIAKPKKGGSKVISSRAMTKSGGDKKRGRKRIR